jgi:nitrate reductase NapAB chaperone NapD
MYLSGLLVTARPERFDECIAELATRASLALYDRDRVTSRIVAVLEAATIDDEVEQFAAIRLLSSVASVDLVYHYVGDGDAPPPDLDASLAWLERIEPPAPS